MIMKTEKIVSRAIVGFLFAQAVLYGGSKPLMPTNPPPDDVSSPTNAPMMCAGSLRGRGLSQTSQVDQPSIASGGLGNPPLLGHRYATLLRSGGYAAPVMYEVVSNWTARGAYCDWQRIDFSDNFRFPVGTNFIDSVMLMAYGEIKSNLHCSTSTSDFDFVLKQPSDVSRRYDLAKVTTHNFAATNLVVTLSRVGTTILVR